MYSSLACSRCCLPLQCGDWTIPCHAPSATAAFALLAIGAVGYGLSLRFYLLAQLTFGAARTGSVYAFAPLNLSPWVMLTVRWSAIAEITRRSITAKASPARECLVPYIRAITF